MKRLSKADIKARETHAVAIAELAGRVSGAVDDANVLIEELNELVDAATQWTQDIQSQIQEYMEERSEAWTEGERGQAYEEWVVAYELELESVESLEFEGPDVDEFEALPEEPEQ